MVLGYFSVLPYTNIDPPDARGTTASPIIKSNKIFVCSLAFNNHYSITGKLHIVPEVVLSCFIFILKSFNGLFFLFSLHLPIHSPYILRAQTLVIN